MARAIHRSSNACETFLVIWLLLSHACFAADEQSVPKMGELWKSDQQAVAKADQDHDVEGKFRALLKFHSDFPNSARVLRNLAWAAQSAGQTKEATTYLQQYAEMGMDIKPDSPIVEAFAHSNVLDSINEFRANRAIIKQGAPLFSLQDPNLLVEDIGFDPQSNRLILTSVHENKILQCDLNGKCADLIQSSGALPLDAILAIHVDAARKLLWATTAGMNMQADFRAERKGRSALLKFDLTSRRLIKKYEPLDAREHALGDMTLASNGDAYVSDGASGDLYVVRHDRDTLEALVSPGVFISPQTPTLNASETILYVPDYAEGIAMINLENDSITWVKSSRPTALEGIDGLYWTKDGLVATQNGTFPERIVRFHLKRPDYIDNCQVLEANWPELGDPTHGIVVGDSFYFIANSGWDRVNDDGAIRPGAAAAIWKMQLGGR
jgi:hypothetical protein